MADYDNMGNFSPPELVVRKSSPVHFREVSSVNLPSITSSQKTETKKKVKPTTSTPKKTLKAKPFSLDSSDSPQFEDDPRDASRGDESDEDQAGPSRKGHKRKRTGSDSFDEEGLGEDDDEDDLNDEDEGDFAALSKKSKKKATGEGEGKQSGGKKKKKKKKAKKETPFSLPDGTEPPRCSSSMSGGGTGKGGEGGDDFDDGEDAPYDDLEFLLGAGLDDEESKAEAVRRKSELEEEEREKMQVLVSNFTENQLDRYEMYRRSVFPKAAIRRIMQTITGNTVTPNAVIAMSGLTKVFVGEIIEGALDYMEQKGDTGALQPKHLREGLRLVRNRDPAHHLKRKGTFIH